MENSDSNSKLQSNKTTTARNVGGSNFNFPGFLAGIRKCLSSLDSNGIPSLRIPSSLNWPRSSLNQRRWTWGCDKVGLNIINSPKNDSKKAGGALDLRKRMNILFGSQVKRNNLSEPIADSILLDTSTRRDYLRRNYMVSPPFLNIADDCKVGGSNFVSGSEGIADPQPFINPASLLNTKVPSSSQTRIPPNYNMISQNIFSVHRNVNINTAFIEEKTLGENYLAIAPMPIISSQAQTARCPDTDVELSEDYTCITFHRPKLRTNVFGDHVLERNMIEMTKFGVKNDCRFEVAHSEDSSTRFPGDFLGRCYMCKKVLYGEDIYMYRDKGFCSPECREEEINADVSGENVKKRSFSESSHSNSQDDIFMKRRSIAK